MRPGTQIGPERRLQHSPQVIPVAVIVEPMRQKPGLLELVRGGLVLDPDRGFQQVLPGVEQQQRRANVARMRVWLVSALTASSSDAGLFVKSARARRKK